MNALKIFTRFNTPEDHQSIVKNLLKERQLREIIDQLQQLERQGMKSLDQVDKFIELNKKK